MASLERITLATESKQYVQLPSQLLPEEVRAYMELNGIERGYQDGVAVPVSRIYVDEDVVDQKHLAQVRRYNLDFQVEEVSLVAVYDETGELYFEPTNGHHRVKVRQEEAIRRGEPELSIRSTIRYGATEGEIFEMRLEDLNSELNGVIFLRIYRWLSSAYTLNEWSTTPLRYAIDSGQLSPAQAVEFAERKEAKTSFKVKLENGDTHTITPAEKEEVIVWLDRVTRNMRVDYQRLKQYLEVAAVAPDELIKRVVVRGGGGHKGRGKITFDLLHAISKVFGSDCPDLQVAIANACVKQNIPAKSLRISPVLEELRESYIGDSRNVNSFTIRTTLDNLSDHCARVHIIKSKNGRPSITNDGGHEARVNLFWEHRRAEYASGLEQSIHVFKLTDGSLAFFDPIIGVLISDDRTTSLQFTEEESAFLAGVARWKREHRKPTMRDIRKALFGTNEEYNEKLDEQVEIVRRSAQANYLLFVSEYNRLHPNGYK